MPTEPEPAPMILAKKPWLAGCVVHTTPSSQSPHATVWLDGHPVKTLMDTGSTITLA